MLSAKGGNALGISPLVLSEEKFFMLLNLLNKEIIDALPPLYATEHIPLRDKLVIGKFYLKGEDGWCWYVFEGEALEPYEHESGFIVEGDYYFFGMSHCLENEMGYFRLSDIADLKFLGVTLIMCDKDIVKIPYGQLIVDENYNQTFVENWPSSFKDWMQIQFNHSELADIVNHGVTGGRDGLTYYSETTALYNEYHKDIWNMLYDNCSSTSEFSILYFIASFNGAINVENDDHFKNLLVWYATERIAFSLINDEDQT